jgi:hypothetical protein
MIPMHARPVVVTAANLQGIEVVAIDLMKRVPSLVTGLDQQEDNISSDLSVDGEEPRRSNKSRSQ